MDSDGRILLRVLKNCNLTELTSVNAVASKHLTDFEWTCEVDRFRFGRVDG